MSWNCLTIAAMLLFLAACGRAPEAATEGAGNSDSLDQEFVKVAGDYIEEMLAMYPEFATALGDHRYDGEMGDYSMAGITRSLEFNQRFQNLLSAMDPQKLSKTNLIDRELLLNRISNQIYSLTELRSYENNPLNFAPANAIFSLLAREFAPLEDRLVSVRGRLEQFPRVVEEVMGLLKNPPRIHTETAIRQNKGALQLVTEGLDAFLETVPDMKPALEPARAAAAQALERYGTWLEEELLPRSTGDFRLGEAKFRDKLQYTLGSDLSMDEILTRAEADLRQTQQDLYQTALALYPERVGGDPPADQKAVIKAVLDRLAEERPDNATIVDLARGMTDRCTAFVREKQLVSLPNEAVKLIVMPEFQRGVAVAYCDSPGPFERQGETFYAIAPTPEEWPQEQVTSFFREYNNYMLADLTIHEAMPGHYLQLAHANQFQAPTKIRAIFSSGTFVEGWATYAEQVMVEAGYGGNEVKMQQLKMRLRLIINAILDQKIHTAGMTEEDAMRLMMEEGFQELGEAAGKWRRACLTSTQLSTYYVGNQEINDLRKAYQAKHGQDVDLKTMHDAMLSFGSPPARYVKRLLDL